MRSPLVTSLLVFPLLEAFISTLDPQGRLTSRRRAALHAYLEGQTASAAASALGVAASTYNNHVSAAVRDLGVESRLELLRRYAELVQGKTDPPKTGPEG